MDSPQDETYLDDYDCDMQEDDREAFWFPIIGGIIVAIVALIVIGAIIGITALFIGGWPISMKVCLIGWPTISVLAGAGFFLWLRA